MRAIRTGACAALLLVGCLGETSTETVTPLWPWRVGGGFLRDREGRAVILRGVNVSGKNKLPPWFDFQQAPDFARVRTDWGMNAVRLVVEWAAIEPAKGVYYGGYLDRVAQRVAWARDANLAVVVDMHQDVYGLGFAAGGGNGAPLWTCDASHYARFVPTDPWFVNDLNAEVLACYDGFWRNDELAAHFTEAWRRVAARLASFENVVGFDVLNEPYWGTYAVIAFEEDLLGPLYERVVPVVRGEAPGWVAFLEPSAARNGGGTTRLPAPSFANLAYAPHSYDREAESGHGFDPSRRAAILANVAALADEARALGGALWIGEYGTPQDAAGAAPYMRAQLDAADAVSASAMYWDYTKGGYGVLRPDGSEATELLGALVEPYPERVAGDPIAWSFAGGTFTLRWRARGAAATIVSVPARLYPSGWTVDCDGCEWRADGASLVVTKPPAGDPATLSVRAK